MGFVPGIERGGYILARQHEKCFLADFWSQNIGKIHLVLSEMRSIRLRLL